MQVNFGLVLIYRLISVTEEVFAENYDEKGEEKIDFLKDPLYENGTLIDAVAQCPNKANPYHKCSMRCFNSYGRHKFNPSDEYLRLRTRMLRKYPLPDHWLEVGDPITNRYYYWNIKTDMVCWLSPQHPRARITKCDATLKDIALKEREAALAAANRASAIIEQTGRYSRSPSGSSSYDSDDDRRRYRRQRSGSNEPRRPRRRRSRSRSQ
ncbi:Polyglutamine-binding protein 1 [Cichlidogyrus casuarinus]|uniref:Polyglutamine-binding protein 1 n=1 Tax=Cichlidogyrus casuarinus TaxID=1844966 RepID=A0ABD2Q7V9_9PLAT